MHAAEAGHKDEQGKISAFVQRSNRSSVSANIELQSSKCFNSASKTSVTGEQSSDVRGDANIKKRASYSMMMKGTKRKRSTETELSMLSNLSSKKGLTKTAPK